MAAMDFGSSRSSSPSISRLRSAVFPSRCSPPWRKPHDAGRNQRSRVTANSRALRGGGGWGLPLAALLYLGLAALLFSSVWPSPTALQAGVGGDPHLVLWLLRWFPYALQHGHTPLLTTHLDYPTGVNLMWNTAFIPLAAVVAPLTLGAGPVLASNVLLVLSLGASAWCAFLAIRRYTDSPLA